MSTVLAVDLEIADGAWGQHIDQDRPVANGRITRIGVLPRGMASGSPSFALMGTLEDGTTVFLEQSWKNVALGMVALIARWGTP